jgi:methionine synthase I (cobalamin-dependent)
MPVKKKAVVLVLSDNSSGAKVIKTNQFNFDKISIIRYTMKYNFIMYSFSVLNIVALILNLAKHKKKFELK